MQGKPQVPTIFPTLLENTVFLHAAHFEQRQACAAQILLGDWSALVSRAEPRLPECGARTDKAEQRMRTPGPGPEGSSVSYGTV